jgi:uncharacterized membrane protein YidH (DUF202 family)
MIIVEFLADEANKNLLLGGVPESIGLLIFGVVLIAFAVTLRRLFSQSEAELNFEQTARKVN